MVRMWNQWIAEGDTVVAHFASSSHTHGHEKDDNDNNGKAKINGMDIHGTMIFHMEMDESSKTIISGIDYYEAKEIAEEMPTPHGKILPVSFFSAIMQANMTVIETISTPDFGKKRLHL